VNSWPVVHVQVYRETSTIVLKIAAACAIRPFPHACTIRLSKSCLANLTCHNPTVLPGSTMASHLGNRQSEHFFRQLEQLDAEDADYTYRYASPPVRLHALLVALHLPVLSECPDPSPGSFKRHVASARSTMFLGAGRGKVFAAARPPAARARTMLNFMVPILSEEDVQCE